MELILGIDLGTTNSAVAVIQDGQPRILKTPDNQPILPSVVGLDSQGQLLVGQSARNQAILAPERTVKSVKRNMGQDLKLSLGDRQYTPQEISAMILRTLKLQAEQLLGQPLEKAVITVPAFFTEIQREATREAGELAGLTVVRIINEPTAATLVYEPRSARNERLLVYDLGGGTFDVSIVQIEQGVIEVLASHGDTHLGGDDFDQLLLDFVCDRFQQQHGLNLRDSPRAASRLLQAVEEAKKRLSFDACTTLAEEFLAEKDGQPVHLTMELNRRDYEELIAPLLQKTIKCVDAALADAQLHAEDIDKILLVGGSSRTPLVQQLLQEQLKQPPHLEIDPDLCVALGAAVQGGLISGADVGPVLVDITPHTLGIECLGLLRGTPSHYFFSPIIQRNTPLPASRSEIYYTASEGQEAAAIHVLQGENPDARHNQSIGRFLLEGLDQQAAEGSEILVRFELNLDGILTVTAMERATSLSHKLTIENPITQFRTRSHEEAKAKLAEAFCAESPPAGLDSSTPGDAGPASGPSDSASHELVARARRAAAGAAAEDAAEIEDLIRQLQEAAQDMPEDELTHLRGRLEDLVFYLEDA